MKKKSLSLRDVAALITFLAITLAQLSFLLEISVKAQNSLFVVQSYGIKSSAGTSTIYPGSRNTVLMVNVLYNGSSPITVSSGCIELPQGFTISRTYSACVPPQKPNGSTYSVVYPGDVIVFTYHIDIDSSVVPGSYQANITIYYRVQGSLSPLTETVKGIIIKVSPYPPLSVNIVDWYWSPDAYPGSQGVRLYMIIKNVGNSTIISAVGKAILPQDIFSYTEDNARFQINNVGKDQTVTVSIGPISVYPNAYPLTSYPVKLELNATMTTDDNVIYTSQATTVFSVVVRPAPAVNIQILDYGIEVPKPVQGVKQARLYLVIRNKDFKIIRSITAYFRITNPGTLFFNNSPTSVTVLQQTLNYGDIASIYSDPLIIGSTDYIAVLVKLEIFGDNNGAEFWSEQSYNLIVKLAQPSVNLEVVDVYWNPSEVYPGTEGASLNIALRNNDIIDLRSCVAAIQLQQGFKPNQISVSDIDISRGVAATIRFTTISIDTNITSGDYPALLTLRCTAYDVSTNSFYTVTTSITLNVKVFEKPGKEILSLISYGWVGNKAYTTTVGASIYVYLQVTAPGYTIVNPKITVFLPKQMIFEDGNRSKVITVSGSYGYAQYINFEIGNIDITTDESGLYPIVVKIEALARTPGEYWYAQYSTLLLRVDKPVLNLSVVDYGWLNNPVGINASGAIIYVTLQSFSIDTIETLIARALLQGASYLNGLNEAVQVVTTPINYGEVQTVRFSDVEVKNNTVSVILIISGVLTTVRGSYYRAWTKVSITLKVVESLQALKILSIHTLYRGTYAPLLPSARGLTISIDIVNVKNVQIAWIEVKASSSSQLKINDISGTCVNGVAPGGVCRIDLDVDVASDASGEAEIALNISYGVRSGSTLSIFRDIFTVTIPIANYNYYRPRVILASVYWGTAQTPARILINQRNAGFTVTIVNTGYYPVEAVRINATPVNSTVMMVKDSEACAPQLAPGTFCSVTLYVDLAHVARGGMVLFKISVKYMFTSFGTAVNDEAIFTVSLPVEEPITGKGLEIIDTSWANNWPVYPETENATFVVTIANKWPYRVSGIDLELLLPPGFYTKNGSIARAYIPGPVNSLQQINAQFTVSVGDIKPGKYNAKLIARYVVESGAPNIRVEEVRNVSIIVNDLSKSVEVINIFWIGKTPEPPEYGAILAIVLRNNYNPAMRGVVMDVTLPEGIVSSDTNSSRVRVVATSINIAQYPQIATVTQAQIMQIISAVIGQQQTVAQFGPGDLLYFYLRLNIATNRTGIFMANIILSFVDQWGNIREIPLIISFTVPGSAKIIEVVAPTTIIVKRGVADLSIGVVNRGSAPVYNVYVSLIPYAAMLVPQQATKYVDVLEPGKVANVSFKLVYNPFAVATGAGQAYLRYMSVPFMASIMFRDVNGYLRAFNTSIALMIEPFIDLVLLDTKAGIRGGIAVVSGSIANYGIASARSVILKALYGGGEGETMVGDLDSASQASFRIEFNVLQPEGDKVFIQVIYRDEYGRVNTVNFTIPIIVERVTTVSTASTPTPLIHNHAIIITLVSVFLALIGLVLYRYLKTYAKAIEKMVVDVGKR